MERINAIVSRNIKYFRKLKNLTQEVLAEKVEVSTIYVSYLERGTKVPSLEILTKIADILQVNPATLLMQEEDYKNLEIKKLIGTLNSLDEPTIRFINDVVEALLKLRNS
jgi:Predicted transcriptional regulators